MTNKYDLLAVPNIEIAKPKFLVKSRDQKLVMRRADNGDFILLAHDQETRVEIPKEDAKDFAWWILQAWKTE